MGDSPAKRSGRGPSRPAAGAVDSTSHNARPRLTAMLPARARGCSRGGARRAQQPLLIARARLRQHSPARAKQAFIAALVVPLLRPKPSSPPLSSRCSGQKGLHRRLAVLRWLGQASLHRPSLPTACDSGNVAFIAITSSCLAISAQAQTPSSPPTPRSSTRSGWLAVIAGFRRGGGDTRTTLRLRSAPEGRHHNTLPYTPPPRSEPEREGTYISTSLNISAQACFVSIEAGKPTFKHRASSGNLQALQNVSDSVPFSISSPHKAKYQAAKR